MIKRKNEYTTEVKVNMRGGDGQVLITHIFSKEELLDKARLFATLTIEPGCSIGLHQHENEQEYFYILKGNPTYIDDDQEIQLYEGDSTICIDNHYHSIRNYTDKTVIVLACIITK